MANTKKPIFNAPYRSISDASSTMPFLATIPTVVDTQTDNDTFSTTGEPETQTKAEDRYTDLGLIGKEEWVKSDVFMTNTSRNGRPKGTPHQMVKQTKIIRRFEEEARLTARLQHPGIVPVHEIENFRMGVTIYNARYRRRDISRSNAKNTMKPLSAPLNSDNSRVLSSVTNHCLCS